MVKDPYRYFRVEAGELLEQLSKGVLDLEKDHADLQLVNRLLRLAHTLKGAARVVKHVEIADLIHGVEDTLAPYRVTTQETGALVPRAQVDSVLAALDTIRLKLKQLPLPQDPDVSSTAQTGAALKANAASEVAETQLRMMRADVLELDVLLEGLGEIGSELASMRDSIATMERQRDLAAQLIDNLAQSDIKARSMADEVHESIAIAGRNMSTSVERIERELRQARDATERLKLVPVSSVFNTLERTARDAAHSIGKQVVFIASGGDVRIDGEVLDSVQSALIQLVRNAVVHGIETEGRRQAAGKPAEGRITLEVIRRGYHAWFRCSDDGSGVDLDAVKHAMLKKGVTSTELQGLSATQLLALLLQGGVTTASAITELAGRGVGLDVVREVAQRYNGSVAADTTAGRGTTIELRVPLSLATLEVLMVEVDGQIVALPLDAVRRTLRVAATDLVQMPEGAAIVYEGEMIPLLPLTLAVHQQPVRNNAKSTMTAVIVATAETKMAMTVSRLHGIDTIVLRPLPAQVPVNPIVLGMHLDTGGNPRIVLDTEQFAALRRATHSVAETNSTPRPILIIDDSLTTRMLESSILESAGFVVELAASAEEGLEMARNKRYALFLVDVEMPGMDGFGFVTTTRADPVLCETPSILVTSCDSPEDRRRGIAAGASAYIVKSEFDQVKFLQCVSELVQR